MFDKNVLMLYFKDIESFPLLSHDEEIKLALRIKKNDSRASKTMIQSNLRLVVNIAKRYAYTGLPMLDIIEEGNIGLMKAVKKYDPGRGYRFSTYAGWWIRQYIMRAIANQGKTIRVPVYMVETIIRYKKVLEELKHKFKRDPAVSEIAKKMKLTVRKIGQIAQAAQSQPTSMETPIGEEQGGRFLELIEDESAQLPDERMSDALRDERIRKLLDKLELRDKKILMLRFGLDEKRIFTLQEIAKTLKITKERVRQIEKRAIEKLKKLVIDDSIEEGMKSGDL